VANAIAGRIRESGVLKRDAAGKKIVGADGVALRVPGLFRCVKAMGVALPRHGIVQLSCNLTDFHTSAPHEVYRACVEMAREVGVNVSGSEIVGLIPKEALLLAGNAFGEHGDEAAVIDAAVRGLGLSDLAPFVPRQKVIELCIEEG